MKKNLLILTLLFFAFTASSQEYIFKFKVSSKEELKVLTEVISIDNYKNGEVTAYANPKQFEKFKSLGYKYEILPHPSQGKVINMATTVAEMANWDRYPTYDVYVQMMQDFQTNFPALCDLDTIGYSQNGRLVLVLKISDNVATHEQEPEFFYTSSMHGDEITGFVLTLRLADYLLSNYGTNTEVTNIINNFELYINPAANPDGTYNGGNTTVASAVRSLANGQDPNRDFPDPRIGANTPYSQETQDMMDFVSAHHFVMSANFHGGAEVMNYPWDTWTTADNANVDANWFEQICTNYVQTTRLINSSYMTDTYADGVTEGGDWYVITGGRQDYMTYFQHCKEVTVELSSVKLLSTDLLPAYWNYNKQALLDYIKEANYGINGTVKNINGDPLDAKIEITAHDKDNSWVATDPANGDYYRLIAPGTYDVTYSSFGYISQVHTITVTAWKTTVINDVVLLQAANVNISGTVTENGTGNPLQGVKIEILNTTVTPVYTAADGTYTINNVPEDIYDIKATLTGYTSVTKTIDISTTTVIDFSLSISNAISFETDVPSIFTFSGNLPWTRVTPEAYDGIYSMKSGAITDNQTSVMQTELNITTAGNISFYKKVSSESNWDFLKFYIDGTEQGSWSGELAWSQNSYAVSTGIHTFTWEYSKDASAANGSDCAWVDFIEFPEYQQAATYTVTFNVTDGTNPIQSANVNFNSQNISTDASGQAIFSNVNPGSNLPWTVSKTGYNTENGTVTIIDGDVIQSVTLTVTVTYTVTFNVDDGTNPIENAVVNFNSQSVNTDIIGQAVFTNINVVSNSPYSITKSGFNTYDGFISVVDNDVIENVSMSETSYTVTFNITDGTNPIENANINFNTEDILTDINGQAVFTNVLPGNNLAYTITKNNYSTFSGQLDVNNQDVIMNIPLTSVSVDVLLSLSSIKISPNPFNEFTTFEFSVKESSSVFLGIYSYNGQLIKILVNETLNAGLHKVTWNGTDANNKSLSNGLYFCKLIYSGTSKSEKIILIR
ncbi:MAG: carboxypeptidase regulatory-like domain-containing protein [Bacteroidales bacterium]|nr:carboxypeptidase regulatory-like domain-containing protein [Bacteroidales bacterium]